MKDNNNEQTTKKYHAFISYRHADNKEQGRQWATWLHQAIETYEVPAELVGKSNSRGEVIPARIYPVFRDEQELPANSDLGNSIVSALQETRQLIVLCSPRAVESTYVADEIDYFKKLGYSEHIIAAMIDGEPNASWDTGKLQHGFKPEDECFPTPLQFEYDKQGNATSKRAEPIAADFRINNEGIPEQGWTTPEAYRQYLKANTSLKSKTIERKISAYKKQQQLMLLKIIAGILGVPLGELTHRDKEYQLIQERLKAKKLRRWLATVALLAVMACGTGIFAFIKQQQAVQEQKRAEALLAKVRDNLNFMNFDLRKIMIQYVPTNIQVDTLKRIDELVDTLENSTTTADLHQIAVNYSNKADVLENDAKSDHKEVLELRKKAHSIFESLAVNSPNNMFHQIDLAVSHCKLGEFFSLKNKTKLALKHFQKSLDITRKLISLHPSDTFFQEHLSSLHMHLAIEKSGAAAFRSRNDLNPSIDHFQKSIDIGEKLISMEPTNTSFKQALVTSHNEFGLLLLKLTDTKTAKKHFQASIQILNSLTNHDSIPYKFSLSQAHKSLGEIELSSGRKPQALSHFKASQQLTEELLRLDSGNTRLINTSLLLYDQIGSLLAESGKKKLAFEYEKEFSNTIKKLIKIAPNEISYLNKLSSSLMELGKRQLHLLKPTRAFKYYKASIDIREKLIQVSPENSDFLHNLLNSYITISSDCLLGEDQQALNYANKAIDLMLSKKNVIKKLELYGESTSLAASASYNLNHFKQADSYHSQYFDTIGLDITLRTHTDEQMKLLKENYHRYVSWAWVMLHADKAKEAIILITELYKKFSIDDCESTFLQRYLAHAYLLSGNYAKAKTIYKKYRNSKVEDCISWDMTIIDDFVDFERQGITTPDFYRISEEVFNWKFEPNKRYIPPEFYKSKLGAFLFGKNNK